MNLRKIAAVAIFSSLSVSAFAAPVDSSDGRLGGAFWSQPITAGSATAAYPVGGNVIGQADASDGRVGGAFWGNTQAVANAGVSNEQFVATSQVTGEYDYLDRFNP